MVPSKLAIFVTFGALLLGGVGCHIPPERTVLAPGPAAIDLRQHGPVALVLADPPRGSRPQRLRGVRHFPRAPQDLEDALVAALIEASVPVVERTRYDTVLAELRISRSDLFDPQVAARIGEHVGARTIIAARVSEWGYDVASSVENRVRRESFTGRIAASVRVIDVETSALMAALSVDDVSDLGTYAAGSGEIEASRLLAGLKDQAVEKVTRHVVPIPERTRIRLFGSLPELEIGNRAAEIGSWQDAERLYAKALESAPDELGRDKAAFNLAVAKMFLRKFEEALTLLRNLYIRTEHSWVRSMLDECERRASQSPALVRGS
ncbi:MAG TPA: CsgG/HfaB family protein [Planctomycetota bacterium]|nr:CsgG/HfaB family protein [Planctomycetota bacterium]